MKASNTIIVSSDQIQIVRLNAIIHNQREKLRTLNEDKTILKAENEKLKKKLAIATKALELYQNEEPPKNCPKEDEKGSYYPFRYNYVVAKEALKQIKELSK